MYYIAQLSFILSILLQLCNAYNTIDGNIVSYRPSQKNNNFTINYFEDGKEKIVVDSTRWINVTIENDIINDYPYIVEFSIDDSSIAALIFDDNTIKENQRLSRTVYYNSAANNHTFRLKFSGIFIGRTKLRVNILDADDKSNIIKESTFPLVVIRQNGMIVDLFLVISGMFVLFINVGKLSIVVYKIII